jgi:hypothetical protein
MMNCGLSNFLAADGCNAGDDVLRSPLSPTSNQIDPTKPAFKISTPTIIPPTPRDGGISGASPSPCLLNPMADDDWKESSARSHVFFPRLESSCNDDADCDTLVTPENIAGHGLTVQHNEQTIKPNLLAPRPTNTSPETEPALTLMPLQRTRIHLHLDDLSSDSRGNWTRTPRDVGAELTLVLAEEEKMSIEKDKVLSNSSCAGGSLVMPEAIDTSEADAVPPSQSMLSDTEDVLPDSWCTDPACSFALKDFTEGLHNMFASLESGAYPEKAAKSKEPLIDETRLSRTELDEVLAHDGAPELTNDDIPCPVIERRVNGRRICNRAANMSNAKARRWQDLRNEMTFAPVLEGSRKRMQVVQTTKSCDNLDSSRAVRNEDNEKESSLVRSTSTGFLESLLSPFVNPEQDSSEPMEAFYDSDPEHFRDLSFRKGPRRVVAEMRNRDDAHKMRKSQLRSKLVKYRAFERKNEKAIDERQALEIVEVSSSIVVHHSYSTNRCVNSLAFSFCPPTTTDYEG